MGKILTILVCFAIGCAFAVSASADIYGYADEDGGIHLTDNPTSEDYQLLAVSPVEPVKTMPSASATTLEAKGGAEAMSVRGLQYQDEVSLAAKSSGVDSALLHAVITAESNYNPRAVSHKGAAGLMQLMPRTARQYGVSNLYDPVQNIQGGARYLAYLLGLFKNDLVLAVAAYNAGENAVIQHGNKIPPYRETVNYVGKVMGVYKKLRSS